MTPAYFLTVLALIAIGGCAGLAWALWSEACDRAASRLARRIDRWLDGRR